MGGLRIEDAGTAGAVGAVGAAGAAGKRGGAGEAPANVERTQEVEDLLEVLAGIADPEDVYRLLQDLFTVREIRETSQRLLVARLLNDGKSYNVIEQQTGASATTIARVSKCLANGPGGYAIAIDVLNRTKG